MDLGSRLISHFCGRKIWDIWHSLWDSLIYVVIIVPISQLFGHFPQFNGTNYFNLLKFFHSVITISPYIFIRNFCSRIIIQNFNNQTVELCWCVRLPYNAPLIIIGAISGERETGCRMIKNNVSTRMRYKDTVVNCDRLERVSKSNRSSRWPLPGIETDAYISNEDNEQWN